MKKIAFLIASLCASGAFAQAVPSNALPAGGVFTVGSGTISQAGTDMAIQVKTQNGGNAMIDWTGGFNVGSGASVTFQNGVANGTLKHIVNLDRTGAASQIFGKMGLPSDVDVILVNPNGILVGSSASLTFSGSGQAAGLYFVAGNATAGPSGNVTLDLTNAPIMLPASTDGLPAVSDVGGLGGGGIGKYSSVSVGSSTANATAPVGYGYATSLGEAPVVGKNTLQGSVDLSTLSNDVFLTVPDNAVTYYTLGSDYETSLSVGNNSRLALDTVTAGNGTINWIFSDIHNTEAALFDDFTSINKPNALRTTNVLVGDMHDSKISGYSTYGGDVSGTLGTAEGHSQINMYGNSRLTVGAGTLQSGLRIAGDDTAGNSVSIKLGRNNTNADATVSGLHVSGVSVAKLDYSGLGQFFLIDSTLEGKNASLPHEVTCS